MFYKIVLNVIPSQILYLLNALLILALCLSQLSVQDFSFLKIVGSIRNWNSRNCTEGMKLYGCLRKAGALFLPMIFQRNLNDMKINLINMWC